MILTKDKTNLALIEVASRLLGRDRTKSRNKETKNARAIRSLKHLKL